MTDTGLTVDQQGFTVETATAQASAFNLGASQSPIPQIAALLRRRGREWNVAVADLETALDSGVRCAIMFVGTIEPGMWVINQNETEVLRVLHNGGQISLQVKGGRSGQEAVYMNFISAHSPIVALL